MGRSVLRSGGSPGFAQRGFTIIEVMTAMVITITVMLANLYLFDIARKNMSQSRALTAATNLATSKIADFKTMDIAHIKTAPPETVPTVLDGIEFARTWVVSDLDLDHNGTPDMVGDVVKIRLDVGWTQANKDHHVTMTMITTGKSE